MVTLVSTIADVRARVAAAKQSGRIVGFVPTMGALHAGHARLIEQCRAETDFVVVSIFVNPTQFALNEDLARYPRTLAADLELCEACGADVVFAPAVEEMYPRGGFAETFVDVPTLSSRLEGASRPDHFRGVATVVLKLFAITQPELAFFGAKDYQQQIVIRRMVDDLRLPVTIRTVATVREPDGLALSSRNRYLNPAERAAATVLFRALTQARAAVAGGMRKVWWVRQILVQTIESEELAVLDYACVVDADSLEDLLVLESGRRAVALLAVRIGATRLIDNAVLTD